MNVSFDLALLFLIMTVSGEDGLSGLFTCIEESGQSEKDWSMKFVYLNQMRLL